ncbi:MAG: NAD(P)H-dependent oxidoreductase [Bacteroidales bacterium]|nr:NAD(P)H-dependent oxidoreductase [Bacteroidales bacterium]
MKKVFKITAAILLAIIGLNACNAETGKKSGNIPHNSSENKKENFDMKGKKILVAYFSWSGNTKDAAQYIAKKLEADVFEIIREKEYPSEYTPCTEEAKAEKDAEKRPAIKGMVDNMVEYDIVFVCVPVWWYTAPMPVFSFLEQYDLKGKTVIPFCTAYSGPSSTLSDIVDATPKSNHKDGLCIRTHEQGGKGMDKNYSKIDKWLKEIGF